MVTGWAVVTMRPSRRRLPRVVSVSCHRWLLPWAALKTCATWRRSEDRRVGKEWRSRWSPYHSKKEDGIRDLTVTGVQTCALPIYDCPGSYRCHATDGCCRGQR